MSDSILEEQRVLHEEIERYRAAAINDLTGSTHRPYREKIHTEHRVRKLCKGISERSTKLVELYEDSDGLRDSELKAISGPDEFAEFYRRLRTIKDQHRNSNDTADQLQVNVISAQDSVEGKYPGQALVEFSGEESHGRYLDLHKSYEAYLNLSFIDVKIDYMDYVLKFDRLFDITQKNKNAAYRRYVDSLLAYLTGFYERAHPLVNLTEDLEKVEVDFVQPWTEGTFPGWPKDEPEVVAAAPDDSPVNLDDFSSAKELEALGLDHLKSALTALTLKAGGTIEQRAERLFSVKGKPMEEWDKSILAATKGKKKGKAKGKVQDKSEVNKAVAMVEAKIYRMAELLGETRQETRENVERKQSRNVNETEEEDATVEIDFDEDEEEDDEDAPYNPKKLPLGWDGKPIPYWLYKLHGLNVSYSCEICGDEVYKGPKSFQLHFKDWRHAKGMRLLGIPNTKHFQNVTKIEDAKQLWEGLQSKKAAELFSHADEEEFEDSQGNVVNKKTFEDLKREGLL
eukprot:m.116092 g.116092  ORF g.116092 m.116092 type:complete len:513 (-) comp28477_c0_seq2:125-1663(-)